MATRKAKRGRPLTFEFQTRKILAALIRRHGARRAQQCAPISVSVATLLKIAREDGIELRKGRRRKSAA